MGKFTEYRLPLKTLAEGTHEFEYRLGKQFFANMEDADVREADLRVSLVVTHRHELYQLDFAIEGTVTLLCDRCLDDLVVPLEAAYSISVKYGDDYNDDSDTLLVIPQSDNYLNVAYMLHDTVVLALPAKHVHPLGKCNRAMSAMLRKHRAVPQGEDAELEQELMDEMDGMDQPQQQTTDPRWDALKNLNENN